MRVATFNLYQFLEPPFHWYEKKANGKSTYRPDQWQQKQDWITAKLAEMDADVVGFQEVFSPAALEALCAAAGYPHFATVDTPGVSDEDPEIFVKPVVAVASRHPITTAEPVTVDAALAAFLPVEDDFAFSRVPVRAVIATPEFGDVSVYVSHLKSKRPVMDTGPYPDDVPWRDRVIDTMRRTSRGHVAALLQRGAEAAALYFRIVDELEQTETRPIIVLGDLNDDSKSVALGALTMQGRIHEIGEVKSADWPRGTAGKLWRYRLTDAWNAVPNPGGKARPGTHVWDNEWSTLDYILLSDVFSVKSPNMIGQVVDFEVLNDHILSDGVGNHMQSDHGLVVVDVLPNSM